MKERALTLALAIAALLLFYALVFPKPSAPAAELSLPVSTDSGDDGLAGAARWLAAAGIPVTSLRQRYDQLPHLAGVPARGNLLISSLPQRLPTRLDEAKALDDWLERGNTLLLLAALDDTPRWAVGADPDWLSRLQALSGVHLRPDKVSAADPLNTLVRPQSLRIRARGQHPLMAGVASVRLLSDLPAAHWHAQVENARAALAVAERVDDAAPVMWVQLRGNGQLLLLAVAAPFSNRQIAADDNARLLANLVAWSRGAGGRVIFDDAHQGVVSFYDPHAFYADPRLHRTFAWIVLLWLVWALGAQTLRGAQPMWEPLDETALLEASGRFYAARVSPLQAARQLLTNFFNEIHRRLHQPEDDSPPWTWLAAQPGVAPAQLGQLRQWYAQSVAAQGVNLMRLQNLLSQLRGAIE